MWFEVRAPLLYVLWSANNGSRVWAYAKGPGAHSRGAWFGLTTNLKHKEPTKCWDETVERVLAHRVQFMYHPMSLLIPKSRAALWFIEPEPWKLGSWTSLPGQVADVATPCDLLATTSLRPPAQMHNPKSPSPNMMRTSVSIHGTILLWLRPSTHSLSTCTLVASIEE